MSSITLILENCLKRTNSFIRFLLVGVINTAIGLSVMLLLLDIFNQSYWFSTFSGNCIGACISYLLNRVFTFQSKVNISRSLFRFIIVILTCYFLSYTVGTMAATFISDIYLVRSILSNEELAVFIGTAIYMLTNYLGQKYFVFKK